MKIKRTQRPVNLVRPESKETPGHVLVRYGEKDDPFFVALENLTFESESEKAQTTISDRIFVKR